MRYIIILMIFGTVLLAACTKSFDPGTTTTVNVANEWLVNNKAGDATVKLITYNTASNPDSIWIASLDTLGADYSIKCKMKVDLPNYTFSTQNAPNASVHMTNTLTITNGKILPNATSVSKDSASIKVTTDSIYLELQYSDEPGKKYYIKGHARTRWDWDEY